MGVVGDNAHRPEEQKFLRRFFLKAAAFFYPVIAESLGFREPAPRASAPR
jgi:hypothetical protein